MYKVLIVEDDPMVAMINEQYINRNKSFKSVAVCKDGKSALAYLNVHKIDLVILDVYMPHMDGFETLRNIRKQQIMVDVIMVTAAKDKTSLEEALHLGIVDYLVKPFTFDRFQVALDKFIAQTHALKDIHMLTQSSIDTIMDTTRRKSEELLPKGIQKKTMDRIVQLLKEQDGIKMTGDEIAGKVGLTGVTVRRYMNYLADIGKVHGEMNYETGGRPCMKYCIINSREN